MLRHALGVPRIGEARFLFLAFEYGYAGGIRRPPNHVERTVDRACMVFFAVHHAQHVDDQVGSVASGHRLLAFQLLVVGERERDHRRRDHSKADPVPRFGAVNDVAHVFPKRYRTVAIG